MYIQGTSMEDLDWMLRVTAKEALQYGCTWSILKFRVDDLLGISFDNR